MIDLNYDEIKRIIEGYGESVYIFNQNEFEDNYKVSGKIYVIFTTYFNIYTT